MLRVIILIPGVSNYKNGSKLRRRGQTNKNIRPSLASWTTKLSKCFRPMKGQEAQRLRAITVLLDPRGQGMLCSKAIKMMTRNKPCARMLFIMQPLLCGHRGSIIRQITIVQIDSNLITGQKSVRLHHQRTYSTTASEALTAEAVKPNKIKFILTIFSTI